MGTCSNIERIIILGDAIKYSPISIMLSDEDITNTCLYSWGNDKANWSCWSNYSDYKKICKKIDSDFYLRIRYGGTVTPSLYINDVLIDPKCYSISIYYSNPFLNDPCSMINASGFDLYAGWDCALQMQQQLSDQVVCMAGIPIYYFRVQPDASTKSYTFKEYVMHGVESVKQLKMVVADGTMPSSKPALTEWDLDFELDWETELSKTQFATAFGTDAFPKQRDFVWVPLQKRMYMVNTAYEEKNEGFMWRATTWKLALVKYQDQSNVDTNDFESLIDSLIVNKYSDVFETGEKREGELTGTRQISSPTASYNNLYNTSTSDSIRSYVSINKLKIVDRQINHGNIIVTKNKYVFLKDSEVHYQKSWCGSEGTVSIVFDFMKNTTDDTKVNILSIGDWCLQYYRDASSVDNSNNSKKGYLVLGDQQICIENLGSTYMCIIRWSRNVGEMSLCLYELTRPNGVPSYKVSPTMYKFVNNDNNISTHIDGRLISQDALDVTLYGYPLDIANLKVYNKYINDDAIDEVFKYTTKNEYCVINDQARPFNTGLGYNVR